MWTNNTLAAAYYNHQMDGNSNVYASATYNRFRKAIENSPIDIQAYYLEHENLDDLKVKLIGPGIRGILEKVLTDPYYEKYAPKER
jgi:hypothetical protein